MKNQQLYEHLVSLQETVIHPSTPIDVVRDIAIHLIDLTEKLENNNDAMRDHVDAMNAHMINMESAVFAYEEVFNQIRL